MNYFTYIIYSLQEDMFYIGQTNNLENRLHRHNSNQNKFTKNKGEWKLIWSKSFATRAEAVQLEIKLKAVRNKQYLKDWITKNKAL